MNLSSDAMVKANLGTLATVLVFLASVSWVAFGYAARIESNTQSTIDNKDGIEEVVLTLQVIVVSEKLADLKKERRILLREQRADLTNEKIASDLDEVNDGIEEAIAEKDCILDPLKPVCN